MSDCIFCKIISGEIPSTIIAENEHAIAFNDIDPQAPVHVLIIPKKHITSLNELDISEDKDVLAGMIALAQEIAEKLGVKEDGYRLVNNCGELGGQAVGHIHFHLLGGRQMTWPAG